MQGNRLIIILVFLAVITIGWWYILFRTPQITGLEAALRTATFLDKNLLLDGSMLYGFRCVLSTNQCELMKSREGPPQLSQAIDGYYMLAKATGDKSYLKKADRAMNFVLKKCQTNVETCVWNFSPLARYYFDTKDDKYLRGMLHPAEQFLIMSNTDIINQSVGHKLASLYEATGDIRYKNRLLAIADEELLSWPRGQDWSRYSIQVAWSVFVPAYTVTHDQKYLTASENFFNSFDLAGNFGKLDFDESVVRGADALLSLADMSDRGAVYRAQAQAVLQEAIVQLWDNPQNPKINGDYGFLDTTASDRRIRFKMTLTNGWFMKLFTSMADEKFNLPIK